MHTRYGFAMTTVLLTLSAGSPNVKTREIEYRQGDTVLQGFIAWDDAAPGKRPGVLVVHEWWGHNDHARNQARRLAEAGYVGFALDMYGKGKVTTHPQDAQAFVAEVTKDPAVLAARFNAALEQLKRDPHVDTTRIATIGYCFGGAVVLGDAEAVQRGVLSDHGAFSIQISSVARFSPTQLSRRNCRCVSPVAWISVSTWKYRQAGSVRPRRKEKQINCRRPVSA